MSEKAAQVGAPPSSETHHVQVFWTFDDPGSTQYGTSTGCLPFLNVIRATFVLKFGALTQISSVCPARNWRCFFESEAMTLAAAFLTFAAFSVFDLNGHFLPEHLAWPSSPSGTAA